MESNIKQAVEKALDMLQDYVAENGGNIFGTLVIEDEEGRPTAFNIKID